ncbi:MAG: NYN domain-containing protein [FCB group bacterium]|nr:NYN domain-containing protein [FCB group bacterium]
MKSPEKIIIDGYNLIHKIPELREFLSGDPELARDQLLLRLSDYRSLKDRNIEFHVFFDGQGFGNLCARQEGIVVTFTSPGIEADEAIRLLFEHNNYPRDWLVVSSDDWDITNGLRLKGVRTLRSEIFAGEMEQVLSGALQQLKDRTDLGSIPKPADEAVIRVAKSWVTITCSYKFTYLYLKVSGDFTIKQNSWPQGINLDQNGGGVSISQLSGELEPHDILFEFTGSLTVNKLELIDAEGRSRAVRLID